MLEPALFEYAVAALSGYNLCALLVGITVGLVIGAIPGLSPPIAIALLLPVSFGLPSDTALILMTAVYGAGIYGGSFSAILLRIPGTSASAASAIEGYELTRRGKAVEAIRISTVASVGGGVISAVMLLLLAPPLANVALWFGPAEMFLLAILGLTAIAAVTFRSLYRGLLAGLVGLYLSTFGIDNYSGHHRYTFDYIGFEGGISILPAIVGLFAFAQGLELCRGSAREGISNATKLSWRIWPKYAEVFHVRWSLIRGWLVGVLMGIVPAAGATVAQWIAYAWECQHATPEDRFQRGEIKGLAATEASNNGSTGTSLIPLFVLGIPGGMSAVVILGALMVHGLQPGMRLFHVNPEIVYTIMWGFLFANLLMGLVAAALARIMANLTLCPRGVLGPLILVFSVVGTYTGTSNIHDVWIMIGFGVVGYFAFRWRFSPPALMLGLILGPIAENGFRDMMVVSNNNPIAYIASRPISLIILLLIAGAFLYAFNTKARGRSGYESSTAETN